jgi:inosose dehydratase
MIRRDFFKGALVASIALESSLDVFAKNKYTHKLGYSVITWNGNDLVAIKEIASLGFKGIQIRANSYPVFKDRPADLLHNIMQVKLDLAMYSSGNVGLSDDIKKETEPHLNHAKFISSIGGKSMQITNNVRPHDRPPNTEELKKYAKNITAVAKTIKEETGVQMVYHNHMHQLGETPEEVDIILTEMDTRYIKLLLDVAHYHQGGGVPADAVLKYKDILYATHIKDTNPDAEASKGYKFVELGQGKVDFKSIFQNLEKIKFKGWNIVELDAVPVKGRTALDCATISKKYLQEIKVMQ